MKKAIIFGTGVFPETLYYYLRQQYIYIYIYIYGFTVENGFRSSDTYLDLPLVDFENVEKKFPPDEYGIYICLGYTNMNSERERIFKMAKEKGYEILSFIHPSAVCNAKSMGIGNIIFENAVIGPFCEIGDGNIFKAGANIAHHSSVGNFNFFAVNCSVAGKVTIKNKCFLGNNCTVKNDITIADKTLVGAGCYISKDTEPYEVYVPARTVCLQDKRSTDFF